MALPSRNFFSECLTVTGVNLIRTADRVTREWYQLQYSITNINIILFASTTAAPATSLSTTRQAVQLGAPTKRQLVTEAKGVALLCYV